MKGTLYSVEAKEMTMLHEVRASEFLEVAFIIPSITTQIDSQITKYGSVKQYNDVPTNNILLSNIENSGDHLDTVRERNILKI